MCIFIVLERKVDFGMAGRPSEVFEQQLTRLSAFQYLAAHDVEWGAVPINWAESPDASERVQWLVSAPIATRHHYIGPFSLTIESSLRVDCLFWRRLSTQTRMRRMLS